MSANVASATCNEPSHSSIVVGCTGLRPINHLNSELILKEWAVAASRFTTKCALFEFGDGKDKSAIRGVDVSFSASQNCLLVCLNDFLEVRALW
jgi:hypothetical protein